MSTSVQLAALRDLMGVAEGMDSSETWTNFRATELAAPLMLRDCAPVTLRRERLEMPPVMVAESRRSALDALMVLAEPLTVRWPRETAPSPPIVRTLTTEDAVVLLS